MESLPLVVLARAIQENEHALHASFGEQGLPDEWRQDLAALPRETPAQQLTYFARVKHFYWLRYTQLQEKRERRGQASKTATEAARSLLRREPVRVELAGRAVHVTGRSYNALAQIAAHHLRSRGLASALEHIEALYATTMQRHKGWRRRRRVRQRLRWLEQGHARLLTEMMLHRRALYAHAFTPDGAAATDVGAGHPAPWWRQTTLDDDMRLFLALWEAGPGRYEKLGRILHEDGKKCDAGFVEDFGFHSLLIWLEGKRHLEPAALYDVDAGQWLTSLRAGALRFDAEEQEV